MTKCYQSSFEFPPVKRRKVEVDFNGIHVLCVTNLQQSERYLYDQVYCARGEMENRIKDQQTDLFAGRTSCHRWWRNQFRQLLSGIAYVLFEGLRRHGLKDTALEKAAPNTLRLALLKIGAVVARNTRRIRVMMSSAYPHKDLFTIVAQRLIPPKSH